MTRMTREFSLVLLGAGMLAATGFLLPEQDLEAKTEEQARARVGGHSHVGGMHSILWLHGGYGNSVGRPSAVSSFARGGFGSTASRMGGGFG